MIIQAFKYCNLNEKKLILRRCMLNMTSFLSAMAQSSPQLGLLGPSQASYRLIRKRSIELMRTGTHS
jgi:hypothetical protein